MQYQLIVKQIMEGIVPEALRKNRIRDYLYSAAKALQTVNDDFYAWKQLQDDIARHNGQVIEMEHYLNAAYSLTYNYASRDADITAGTIIYIDTVATTYYRYLRNKIEGQSPIYMYNKWDSGKPYVVDDRVRYGAKTYKCILANTGQNPATATTYWTESGTVLWVKNKSEYGSINDFIVKVPTSVSYDTDRLTAQVKLFSIAGKRFTIQTY